MGRGIAAGVAVGAAAAACFSTPSRSFHDGGSNDGDGRLVDSKSPVDAPPDALASCGVVHDDFDTSTTPTAAQIEFAIVRPTIGAVQLVVACNTIANTATFDNFNVKTCPPA